MIFTRNGGRTRPAHVAEAATVALAAALLAGCGLGPELEAVSPERKRIEESFTEPARTRLARTYRVSAPVAGRIGHVGFQPGDDVTSGQTLAEYDRTPFLQRVTEARSAVAELRARIAVKDDNRLENTAMEEATLAVEAAEESLKAADAAIEAERARAEHARAEYERKQKAGTTFTPSQLDEARLLAETSLIELRKQEFYRAALNAMIVIVKLGPKAVRQYIGRKDLERSVLTAQLAQSEARLAAAEHDLALARLEAPVDGVVLERFDQGERAFGAGTTLLEIGDLDELEVEADVLTQDALKLRRGSRVELEPGPGLPALAGVVERIEPAGFTKLSSLGVEQQRVKVIVALADRPDNLGVGYRVKARFLTQAKEDALVVPRFSVLQAPDRSYYVFAFDGGSLRRRAVSIGLRNDLELEVTDGLSESDRIVARPSTTLSDGMGATPVATRNND